MTATATSPLNKIYEGATTRPNDARFAPPRSTPGDSNPNVADESDLETLAIERNGEFYATVLERISVESPQLIDADDVM